MLTLPQRQSMANELQKLRTILTDRPETFLHELPAELQKNLRQQAAIAPLTSGGLERITSIATRLNWAIYYLNDPTFPERFKLAESAPKALKEHKEATPPTQQEIKEAARVPNPTKEVKAPPAKTTAPPKESELDFGPFDPRKA